MTAIVANHRRICRTRWGTLGRHCWLGQPCGSTLWANHPCHPSTACGRSTSAKSKNHISKFGCEISTNCTRRNFEPRTSATLGCRPPKIPEAPATERTNDLTLTSRSAGSKKTAPRFTPSRWPRGAKREQPAKSLPRVVRVRRPAPRNPSGASAILAGGAN